jgi:mitofusin
MQREADVSLNVGQDGTDHDLSAVRESFYSSSSSLNSFTDAPTVGQTSYTQKCFQLLKLIQNTKDVLNDLKGSPSDYQRLYYPSPRIYGDQQDTSQSSLVSNNGLSILQLNITDKRYPVRSNSINTAAPPQPPSKPDSLSPTAARPEDTFTSQLLVSKLQEVDSYLDKLNARISDTRSRVLVTGDLNAGKSTFVNAILRREVVPDDQQPCTALFCEVVDSDQNDGVEEVHGIRDPANYNREDPSTFERFEVAKLRDVVEENLEGYDLLKVYCKDNRPKNESLLSNGVVDISLIDSPGLNIDSMKTTALFAQQEEIDVIVFVVNSENHFTLSVSISGVTWYILLSV